MATHQLTIKGLAASGLAFVTEEFPKIWIPFSAVEESDTERDQFVKGAVVTIGLKEWKSKELAGGSEEAPAKKSGFAKKTTSFAKKTTAPATAAAFTKPAITEIQGEIWFNQETWEGLTQLLLRLCQAVEALAPANALAELGASEQEQAPPEEAPPQ